MPEMMVGLLFFCALAVTLTVLYLRHRNLELLHRERMAALEKGASIPVVPGPAPWSSRVYLLRGLIWSLTGAALVVFLYGASAAIQTGHESARDKAYQAEEISRSLSISPQQAQAMVEKDAAQRTSAAPLAISMLGLIPLAVGLAYLAFYFTDPSRKAGAR
jgi:hypothetical protein